MTEPVFSARQGRPIVVVGSLNMDLVMRTERVPAGGETLAGHDFNTLPGGKGANQALACARLGGKVAMIGRVGDDGFGRTLCAGLAQDGVDVAAVLETPAVTTGVAVILVEDSGQNRILLAAGANGRLTAEDIDRAADLIRGAALLIVQLEVPLAAVRRAVALAGAAGVPVLLNPAPAAALPADLLAQVDLLVPNETEAALLTGRPAGGRDAARAAARILHGQVAPGSGRVVLTLGQDGVLVLDEKGERHHPAARVTAVDTTAAGDTFIGGLAVGLLEGLELDAAIALGQRAAALCVTRPGAQPSIPRRSELVS
jgi:ribokinase